MFNKIVDSVFVGLDTRYRAVRQIINSLEFYGTIQTCVRRLFQARNLKLKFFSSLYSYFIILDSSILRITIMDYGLNIDYRLIIDYGLIIDYKLDMDY